jgi:glycosyltransferase involved in cell wall biosynthesis
MGAPYGRIGIVGPANVRPFLPYLDIGTRDPESLPIGMGGTPVIHLAMEFLARGYPVSIYTLDAGLQDPIVLKGELLHLYVGCNRSTGWKAVDFFRHERTQLEKFIREDHPSIVHAHWTYEFALAALTCGRPTLVTAHDAPFSVLRFDHHLYRILRTCMALQVARRSRFMTAVSTEVAQHWKQWMCFRGIMRVVPNGLPSSFFRRGERKLAQRRPSEEVTFACVLVGWGGRKNGSAALRAFAEVRKVVPNVRLLLFGTGHGRGEAGEVWAKRHQLTVGVEFIGTLPYEDLADRLEREVDVLVHPALEEALCMSVAEAMCIALPVIADKNTAGMSYLLDDGRAGILVDMRSSEQLAEKMLQMAGSAALRRRYEEAAYAHASRKLTIDIVAAGYERAYAAMLEGPA